ncbi:MAG: hypothetical protein E7623_08395 [Ruminococcaceae bacterium]|nr:hypothetical protein [Oscillospiraceae bacterium]
MSKRPMLLLSIVERDKGKKLIKVLESLNIRMNFQCVGFGTAPTEMMDIFGLGTNDKDIVVSLAAESTVKDMMAEFGTSFESHSRFGGLMIILNTSAAGRVLTELLSHNISNAAEKGNGAMKNEHHNNLIIISVNEGYAEDVMQTARKAGATGGTVIKGRLADTELVSELENTEIDEERELLTILAPLKTSRQIMEDVNREFGINSKANGIIVAIPTEKAYKI